MRLLPHGDRGVLVDLGSTAEAVAWAAALDEAGLEGVEQVVPAARTVLVVGDHPARLRAGLERLAATVASASGAGTGRGTGPVVEVPVVYDGPDLDDVAHHTGLDPADVVAAHTGQTWRVAFGGFAPGFGYLVGEDERLHVPRRPEPRTRVPAGSVALAGEYAGVYPTASPGGWQLVGRTDAVLWDLQRDPPALLAPGVSVRFVDVGGGA